MRLSGVGGVGVVGMVLVNHRSCLLVADAHIRATKPYNPDPIPTTLQPYNPDPKP